MPASLRLGDMVVEGPLLGRRACSSSGLAVAGGADTPLCLMIFLATVAVCLQLVSGHGLVPPFSQDGFGEGLEAVGRRSCALPEVVLMAEGSLVRFFCISLLCARPDV